MYGRIFEEQINKNLFELNKQYITKHLRYRSDSDFFKYEIDIQNKDTEIKKVLKKLNDVIPENPTPEEQQIIMELDRLEAEKKSLKRPKIRALCDKPEV